MECLLFCWLLRGVVMEVLKLQCNRLVEENGGTVVEVVSLFTSSSAECDPLELAEQAGRDIVIVQG